MGDLIPTSREPVPAPTVGVGLASLAGADRRTGRALATVHRNTLVRLASVQGHAMVQQEKLLEVDRLARVAIEGQAMLSQWSATLAHGDAFVADDLKFFTDIAKIGKGEIIADTISDFSKEGRL